MGINNFILTVALISSLILHQSDGGNTINISHVDEGIEINEEVEEVAEDEIAEGIEGPGKKSGVGIVKFKDEVLELRVGISSDNVLRIKRFLREKGYNDINENYYFDNKTREVIMDYQNKKGLNPDGIIGKDTYKVINEDMEINNIMIPEIKVVAPKDINIKDMIIINKDNNTLYHLRDGKVLNRYPVATGKTPGYTPEGQFTIVTKHINPAWGGAGRYTPVKGGDPKNPLGRRWMGLSIKGGGVYGIHGNSDKSSIGKYVSLGCIRMFNEDVEGLYDLIGKGTIVWIGSEARLKEYGILFK